MGAESAGVRDLWERSPLESAIYGSGVRDLWERRGANYIINKNQRLH